MRTIIQNGTIVGERCFRGDLAVEDGRISAIADRIEAAGDDEVVDAAGCYLLPGGIDPHTHFKLKNDLAEAADDYISGSRAALAGGTTTIINFASPVRGEARALHKALEREMEKAAGASCDYAFHIELLEATDSVLEELPEMVDLGVKSYKAYMAYDFALDDAGLYDVIKAAGKAGVLLGVHCENGLMIGKLGAEVARTHGLSAASHPLTRPAGTEAEAVGRLGYLSQMAGYPAHVVHLSSKLGLEELRHQRRLGSQLSAETCMHYLLLDETLYKDEDGAKYICAPPLRTEADREALLEALGAGELQTIGSDHCSFRYDTQKRPVEADFRKVPGGLPGVQFRLPLAYTALVDSGRVTLEAFAGLIATNAAKLYGLYPRKGVLLEGSEADIVLYDPAGERQASTEEQLEAVDYTPFAGQTIKGRVRQVWLRGIEVVRDGEVLVEGRGRYVHENEVRGI